MKLILTILVAAALAAPASAQADAQKEKAPAQSSWGDFFKNHKSTLASSAVGGERKKGRGAAVAAVRGKKQKDMADPNEPTLKGDAKAMKAQKELALDAEFEKAVDLVTKGKLDEGLKALQDFKEKHPKHRVEDVDKAIEGAKAMLAEKSAAPAE